MDRVRWPTAREEREQRDAHHPHREHPDSAQLEVGRNCRRQASDTRTTPPAATCGSSRRRGSRYDAGDRSRRIRRLDKNSQKRRIFRMVRSSTMAYNAFRKGGSLMRNHHWSALLFMQRSLAPVRRPVNIEQRLPSASATPAGQVDRRRRWSGLRAGHVWGDVKPTAAARAI